MSDEMNRNSDNYPESRRRLLEALDLQIKEAQLLKLEKETEQLCSPWWKRPSYVATIGSLILAIATLASILIPRWIDEEKGQLEKDIQQLEEEKKDLARDVKTLKAEKDTLTLQVGDLRHAMRFLQRRVGGLEDSLRATQSFADASSDSVRSLQSKLTNRDAELRAAREKIRTLDQTREELELRNRLLTQTTLTPIERSHYGAERDSLDRVFEHTRESLVSSYPTGVSRMPTALEWDQWKGYMHVPAVENFLHDLR